MRIDHHQYFLSRIFTHWSELSSYFLRSQKGRWKFGVITWFGLCHVPSTTPKSSSETRWALGCRGTSDPQQMVVTFRVRLPKQSANPMMVSFEVAVESILVNSFQLLIFLLLHRLCGHMESWRVSYKLLQPPSSENYNYLLGGGSTMFHSFVTFRTFTISISACGDD